MLERIRHRFTLAGKSVHRDQASGDAAALVQQDVVGADGRAGAHGFDVDPERVEPRKQIVRDSPALVADAQQKQADLVRFGKNQSQRGLVDLAWAPHRPRPHAARQAK
jgi:hypothetical protein